MTTRYGTTFTGTLDGAAPQVVPAAALASGRLRHVTEIFSLASQASGDILVLGKMPAGSVFKGVRITAGASLGTATIAIGIAGTTGKYRAAATFTAVDTPTVSASAATLAQGPLAADELVIATIGTAALPGTAEKLVFELIFTSPS